MKDKAKNKNKNIESKSLPLEIKEGLVNKICQENLEWSRTFDALPHFVCTVDMDGKILRANKAMIARFSAEHGDIIGKDYRLAICGTTKPQQQHTNAAVIGDKPSFWLETELPSIDGWYRIASSPLFDDDGNQLGAVCTISDITERKEAEVKLIRFRAALDSSNDNVYLIDRATMRIVDANRAGWKNLGYTKDELLDLGPHDIYFEYGIEELAGLFDRLDNSADHSGVFETTCLHRDGSGFPAEITIRTLERTQPTMIIASARDISDRKQHEQELIKAKETAEKASKAKSEFLSLMSHELRTPLHAIMGFAQLLMLDRNPALSEGQTDNTQVILDSSNHLLSLVDDILDLATLEAGRIHLAMKSVAIASIFNECNTLLKPVADKRGIKLDMGNSLKTDRVMEIDPARFKQAILNLLNNAIKYNVDNGKVNVILRDTDNGRLRVSITDTGQGVPVEGRHALFHLFSRADAAATTTTGEGNGNGISLVITKNLVELMGGDIGYEPVDGGGSCFWVEFLALNKIKETNQPDDELCSGQDVAISPRSNPVRTLLYVEDDPITVKLVSKLLSGHDDIRLLTASEPALGLKLASNQRLDLVLLDINLPGMSGYELFEHLRNMPHLKEVPVIAVSADAMLEEIERGKSSGFHDYITKPIDVIGFIRKIEDVLALSEKLP